MAEEEKEALEEGEQQEEEASGGGGGGFVRYLMVLVGVMLIGATASLMVYKFVLAPRLVDAVPEPEKEGPEILAQPFMVPFEPALATVIMPDEDYLASTLMYAVELECSDEVAMNTVMTHKARFIDMIRRMHQGRTREELNDPMTDDNIQKQIVQESNAIITAVLGEKAEESRVTNCFHTQWFVKDD